MNASFHEFDDQFWQAIDELVKSCKIIIDRPKGSVHPKFPNLRILSIMVIWKGPLHAMAKGSMCGAALLEIKLLMQLFVPSI